jgi:hypothetical protein
MTPEDEAKVKRHAADHVAYGWAPGLPVRHDRRAWSPEEESLYEATYNALIEAKDASRKGSSK